MRGGQLREAELVEAETSSAKHIPPASPPPAGEHSILSLMDVQENTSSTS